MLAFRLEPGSYRPVEDRLARPRVGSRHNEYGLGRAPGRSDGSARRARTQGQDASLQLPVLQKGAREAIRRIGLVWMLRGSNRLRAAI